MDFIPRYLVQPPGFTLGFYIPNCGGHGLQDNLKVDPTYQLERLKSNIVAYIPVVIALVINRRCGRYS